MTRTDQVRDGFVERLFASALGTMDVFTVYLGDRLGLYRMLAAHGPLTAGELADRAGMYARYARVARAAGRQRDRGGGRRGGRSRSGASPFRPGTPTR